MAIINIILSYAFILLCIFLTARFIYKAIQFLKYGSKNRKKQKNVSTMGMSRKEKRRAKKERKELERKEIQAIRNHIKGGDIEDGEVDK